MSSNVTVNFEGDHRTGYLVVGDTDMIFVVIRGLTGLNLLGLSNCSSSKVSC